MARFTQLQERVYEYLKDKIIKNEFQDNEIYSETKIAEEIGVSRTPVRDALQCLNQEGYIDIIPSKGFRLRQISRETIIKNCQVRGALECYSAILISKERDTNDGKAVIKELEKLLGKQTEIYEKNGSITQFCVYDWNFHLLIVEYTKNDEMSNIFHGHFYYIHKLAKKSLESPGRMMTTLKEHEGIIKAMKFGNEQDVYRAVMIHMNNTKDLNLDIIPKSNFFNLK